MNVFSVSLQGLSAFNNQTSLFLQATELEGSGRDLQPLLFG